LIGYTLQRNCFLEHVIEGKLEEEEDVSSYWMTLGKRDDTGK
jgi:hypothetical protein